MPDSNAERYLIFAFRMLMAWTFIYAAYHQIADPKWTVAGFLSHTKTFHDVYAPFTAPSISPTITFLVKYGHLAIGLSLLVGLMVRVSAIAGICLLMMYWTAHMDWPFIENRNNFIIDYHIVYSTVLIYLIVKRAGHVWGLDAWAQSLPTVSHSAVLRPLVS